MVPSPQPVISPPQTVKAAPQITAEATADVETMIKKRITERKFDDVIRVVPPPLEKEKRVVELDDNKSKKVGQDEDIPRKGGRIRRGPGSWSSLTTRARR